MSIRIVMSGLLAVAAAATAAFGATAATSFRGFSLGMSESELTKRVPEGCRLSSANQDVDYVLNAAPADLLLGDVSQYRVDCGSVYVGSISLDERGRVDKMLFLPELFNAGNYTYSQFLGALQDAYDLNFVERNAPTIGGGTRIVDEAQTAYGESISAAQLLGHPYIVVWPSVPGPTFDK